MGTEMIQKVKHNIQGAIAGASVFMMTAPFAVKCTDFGTFLQGEAGGDGNIEIQNVDNITPANIFGNLLNVLSWAFILIGLMNAISGVFKYLEAHQEDNAAAQNKAIRQIVIGVAFIASPMIIKGVLGLNG